VEPEKVDYMDVSPKQLVSVAASLIPFLEHDDINVIISQIHLLFIKFHNKVVTDLINLNQMPLGADLFAEAQRIVCWHYQWAVIHDFLQRIVGQKTYEQICPDPKNPRKPNLNFYKWSEQPFIPVEFSVAAFRLHTMIRARYALNDKLERNRRQMKQKDVPMFLENVSVPPEKASDLRGLRRLPGDWTIQWNRFLDMPDKKGRVSDKLQMSRALNPKLNLHLKHLPFMSKEDRETGRASLAFRTLQRGCQMGLPSGQAVARRMGYDIPSALDTKQDDPLWYYLMKEAEIPEDQGGGGGKHLGPVGGTLVGEVLFGLLAGDPLSYLNVEPLWSPKKERMLKLIPADKKDPADFRLGDIIRYTQMPVDAADIYQLLGKE
jgi:hypothetical protein